jgi:hypothetical protein
VRGLQRNDDINNHVWNGEIASFNPTTEKYTIKFNDNELKEWPTNQIARVKGCGAGGFCIDMLVRLNIANNSNEEMKVAAYNQSNETYTVVSTSAQSAQQYVDGLHATDLLKTTGESPAHIKIGDIMRAVQHNNSIDSIASGWTVQIIGYSSLVDAYAWVEVLDGPNDLKKQAW